MKMDGYLPSDIHSFFKSTYLRNESLDYPSCLKHKLVNLRTVEKPVRNLSQIERKILDFLSILSNFYNFKGKIRKK